MVTGHVVKDGGVDCRLFEVAQHLFLQTHAPIVIEYMDFKNIFSKKEEE